MAKEGVLSLHSFVRLGWSQVEPARDFVDNWHFGCLSEHLTAISDDQLNRVVFNIPPGTMKSLMCSVFWNAWEWGPRSMPSLRYINFSYDKELSTRDAVRTRRLIESSWYRELWGHNFNLTTDQNVKTRYENDRTGFRIADYVGGGTGDRGDRDVIDDPHNVKDGESDPRREAAVVWQAETLPTRLNDPLTSAIVLVMQRVHEGDLSGEALAKDLGYELVMLPMEYEPLRCCYTKLPKKGEKPRQMRFIPEQQIWLPNDWKPKATDPAQMQLKDRFDQAKPREVYKWDQRTEENELLFPGRFPREVVERDKLAMGEYATAGQMAQRPTVRGGGLIKRHWFGIVDAIPADCRWVRRWDLASTKGGGAYTAGVLMGRSASTRMFYIKNVVRDQLDGNAVKILIKQTAMTDVMDVGRSRYSVWLPQDPGQAGKVQAQDFILMLAGYDVHTEIESGDKVTRSRPFAAQAEAGNVKLLRGEWNEPYLAEMAKFSDGAKYKDQVDASSGAFGVAITYVPPVTIIGTVRGST
jgi:predicted phage terminase large subunit-like protein